ncbi:hypothetical protein [Tenggerimyces flavus]|uniref:Uncharacterized protein n=1 Tax=Tenggerimyces flavus TaxID=1708749 RepID=A0ABV7YDC9_9ACTN|nr:hypothetical protein [Tenggerimyces flavus]MBM7788870.1 phage protein D [Tenggerimyces flavus]
MSRLTIHSADGKHSATLDGDDVTHRLRSMTVDLQGGQQAMVLIEPLIVELDVDTDRARFHVPPDTADLLVSLGWTPPNSLGKTLGDPA